MEARQRFHFIDNLRSIALLLGIVFHAALAYGPYYHNIWFTADPKTSPLFDYLTMWLHVFRMPLFFVIAGFCSALLIAKYASKGFIVNRTKRVLLPFIVFYPLSILAFIHGLTWGATFAEPLPAIFSVLQEVEEPKISTMHLWFLWNLMQFCIVLWVLSKAPKLYEKILSFVVTPLFFCVLLPLLIFFSLSFQSIPFPPPDKLIPQVWSFGFYGCLYIIGAGLYEAREKISRAEKYILPLAVIAIASFGFYLFLMPSPPSIEAVTKAAIHGQFEPEGAAHYVLSMLQTLSIIAWTGLMFLVGSRFLNKESALSRYISDASYWIYLIHVPLLIYIQMPLINLELPALVKFVISTLITLFVGLISYQLLVRKTWLGMFLNGRKHISKLQTSQPASISKSV